MTNPAETLAATHTARAGERRARVAHYLNRQAAGRVSRGGWLSEIGFFADRPFTYAFVDESNLDTLSDPPRAVTGVELLLFGVKRDVDRLNDNASRIRTRRAARASGLAPFPGNPELLGAADLEDATDVPAKTAALLARVRTAGSGEGYHAVVTRAGAVYVCAPLTQEVAGTPTDGYVRVAVEGAGVRPRAGGDPTDAPLTEAQLGSLAVLVAKVRAVYAAVPVSCAGHPAESLGSVWWNREQDVASAFEARVTREGVYDATSEVFRTTPPPPSRRAEAQVALGHIDTVGEASLLLGAYADIAAADRAAQMEEPGRVRYFVQRARSAHTDADAAAHDASTAASAPAFTPVIPPATNSGPFVYNYTTGRWGDNER